MARGKDTCRILKEIRRQIAEANDIELITSECHYKGDCLGTCPKCEAEVRYLEQQLRTRSLAGKAVALAGISVTTLALSMPMTAEAQAQHNTKALADSTNISAHIDTFTVKGTVRCYEDHTMEKIEAAMGVSIINLNTKKGTITDIDGHFEINACRGDSIMFSHIGYESQTIQVSDASKPLDILLRVDLQGLMGEVVVVNRKDDKYIDLRIVDEGGISINQEDIYIERLLLDEDGKEDFEDIEFKYIGDTDLCRIYWDYDWGLQDENGPPLKEGTLRITAEGYEEPIIITVKRPKRHSKKTIRFKHKKQE